MKKSIKFLSMFVCAAGLTVGGMAVANEEGTTTLPTETVQASVKTSIKMYKNTGYTSRRVIKANNGRLSRRDRRKLINGSMAGMRNNHFYDTNSSDQRIVNVTRLSNGDKVELSKYALAVINSARHQMGKRSWTYKRGALHFANRVAANYNRDGMSCWSSDHDVRGIERAAKASGLNHTAGQVYEDEAGLPITSDWQGTTRSMSALKSQIYFNVKQMLFGGYYGNNVNNRSAYTEWEHAGDLLGLRSSRRNYDAKTKYFGLSFSSLDNTRISVHMMGVAKRYILNYRKFNK